MEGGGKGTAGGGGGAGRKDGGGEGREGCVERGKVRSFEGAGGNGEGEWSQDWPMLGGGGGGGYGKIKGFNGGGRGEDGVDGVLWGGSRSREGGEGVGGREKEEGGGKGEKEGGGEGRGGGAWALAGVENGEEEGEELVCQLTAAWALMTVPHASSLLAGAQNYQRGLDCELSNP